MNLKRTHYCGHLNSSLAGQEVTLCGWVDRWRDHGGVVFIDIRDREGITQIVFDPETSPMDIAGTLRQEYVIAISGTVRTRPEGMKNVNLPTGEIEVLVSHLELLNKATQLPFSLHEDSPNAGEVDESLRLNYRYLELRKKGLQKNLKIRHDFLRSAREFYAQNNFWEIETPILYKSTPEGARDYLVPSRVHPGLFYALPQSPQTLKQLCMIGGLDRYVQIARCFRDEDLRADRQPEFTQIDVEMSFVDENDIQTLHETMMQKVLLEVLKKEISVPFQRLKYQEAMDRFGSDKPDLRNSLELVDLTELGKKSTFQVYQTALAEGGILKGLCFEEKESLSRSELDGLLKKVAPFGARGITWIRIKGPGDWQSPQAKFFDEGLKKEIEEKLSFNKPAMLFLMCGKDTMVNNSLSALRLDYGKRFGYTDESRNAFLWVTDFPLLEFNDEDKRFYAAHHPFTRPHPEDLHLFLEKNDKSSLAAVRACAYDLVWNGFEIGGGSLRIYNPEVQSRMFDVLGIGPDEAKVKFGFFLKALQYGTPPHGGIALGVDRIAMLLAGTDAIRDVIAFPKTQKASCSMSEAPSVVDPVQLTELGLKIIQKEIPKTT
ncbi:MAG: aspartate--tRNA ligase [Bdellovibrionales bacterium]|nr:aspartate--tRNA ligase [Bdellovibrionales bacterium]